MPSSERAVVGLSLDAEILRPLIHAIVAEVFAELEQARAPFPDAKLCYPEPEAARLLGLQSHQLRDERLRGKNSASQIVGRRIRYARDDLTAYLAARRASAN